MKIEFEGQSVENLDQFWVNWQQLGYKQACENWEEKKEIMEFLTEDIEDHVIDDFLKRKAGNIYMDRVYFRVKHKIPLPMDERRKEKVYDNE